MIDKLKNLKNHQGFMKYFKNTSWLFAEKILRMFVGLYVGIWVARYLGPEQFGLLSYAQSFVGLFTAISTLGLDGIVIRELVKDEKLRDVLLGTAFWLKLIGAIVVLTFLTIAVNFTSNDYYTNILIFIIASATIFQSFNVIDFYFQSKILSKFVVYANIVSLLLSSIFKITLILYEAPLIAFAWMVLVDSIILAMGIIYLYLYNHLSLKTWTFEKNMALLLLKDSWPLILSGVMITIGLRIDQIMIKEMLNSESVGFYAAGTRLAEVFHPFTIMLIQSIFPKFIYDSEAKFLIFIEKFITVFFWSSMIVCILLGLFLPDILLNITYGEQYLEASSVFSILIFTIPLTFINTVTNKYLLRKNKTKIIFFRQFFFVILNIPLNLMFIPLYGIAGAALATLLGDLFVAFFIDFIDSDSRKILSIKYKMLMPLNYFFVIKKEKSKLLVSMKP